MRTSRVFEEDSTRSITYKIIDLKKDFHSFGNKAVMKALENDGVRIQYIRIFSELYSDFKTKMCHSTTTSNRHERRGSPIQPSGTYAIDFDDACGKIAVHFNLGKTIS